MAVSFKIPKSPEKQVYESDVFLGADFTSEASNIDETKSPNCVNMIRSVPGKIRKRMGYAALANYGDPIYGIHYFSITDTYFIHAGTKLYDLSSFFGRYWNSGVLYGEPGHSDYKVMADYEDDFLTITDGTNNDTLISDQFAAHRSVSFELNNRLVIFDGTKAWSYDTKFGLLPLSHHYISYTPTLTISKDYTGGGQDYEPLNLLNPYFIEQFYVKSDQSTVKTFQMSFDNLDDDSNLNSEAWVLNSDGDWVKKTIGTDFIVDSETGKVTFTVAPGPSPVEGEDNVKIKVKKTIPGYADRINHCTIGTMFGVNGAHDRIFLSGNPDSGVSSDGDAFTYINCDWFCQQYDPTYWADIWYSKLGSDSSAIMGYSIVNNYLATHKDSKELAQSIIIRQGLYEEDQPAFKIINTLQGLGAISKYCFSYLESEPIFLTELGIYAITAQDITGERYAQDRSYYLEGKLLKEDHLNNAHGFTWRDFYMVSVNDHLYVLDGLQPMHTDKAKPYATRQYVGFYFTNIPASCFAEIKNELYFGSMDGHLYKFYSDEKDINSYNDNGDPIAAIWETADIDKQLFYKKKTYRYLAVRCLPEIQSSIKVFAQKEGQWTQLKDDRQKLKYFSYENLQYSKMTYSTNMTQRVSATKIRLKKLDHVRFRFENDSLNEPLSINNFAVEYTQAGNVK